MIKRVIFIVLFLLVSALASLLLGSIAVAGSLQSGCLDCTPGMIVAQKIVPQDQAHAFDLAARFVQISIAIDALILFLLACTISIPIAVRRHNRRERARLNPVKRGSEESHG